MQNNRFQPKPPVFTHEGAKSSHISPLETLKRLTMACMLWEDTFYVDGKTVAEQIEEACKQVPRVDIVYLATHIHSNGLLRHIPLLLIIESLKRKSECVQAIYDICTRPDQMTELLSLYWKDGKKPIAAQLKKGLALAFTRFDRYQLSKYNKDAPIKLKDILFLCHAKPKNDQQAQDWKDLINGTLAPADTWEVRLSAGEDKKQSFTELMEAGKLGRLATLRNLRNMQESGVDKKLVERSLMSKTRPILPFQFIAAAKECPKWEDIIDASMVDSCKEKERLMGRTLVLVDVSGSMSDPISSKSKLNRMDAACAFAILLREICYELDIHTFSNQLSPAIPNRRGMALRDSIVNSQPHSGTMLGSCLKLINEQMMTNKNLKYDRLIIITDEQASDFIPNMPIEKRYILNVANYKNGLDNKDNWVKINGFSEASIDYIVEIEK